MRYDNMSCVSISSTPASCACFALELFRDPTDTWNGCFDALRRGFEMLGGNGKSRNIQVADGQVSATTRTTTCRTNGGSQ
jgi:hypothetical protein